MLSIVNVVNSQCRQSSMSSLDDFTGTERSEAVAKYYKSRKS